jgi:hypothetical protein
VRLSPLGTSATNLAIVPVSDDRWWVWSSRWNENWQEKPKYSDKTYPNAILSTTNPTWPDLGSNPDSRSGKPATDCLSYGTAPLFTIRCCHFYSPYAFYLICRYSSCRLNCWILQCSQTIIFQNKWICIFIYRALITSPCPEWKFLWVPLYERNYFLSSKISLTKKCFKL